MKLRHVISSFATAALMTSALSSTAYADDPAACVASASRAQKLRNAHKLVEARGELRVCAASGCPAAVQSDCVPWLAEVEKLLPGIVVAAKDDAGGDLIDVKVTVDGQPFLTRLDGQSMPIDAGPHTFHFEAADGVVLDRQVVVREGDKGQTVSVVLARPGMARPAGPTPGGPANTSAPGGKSSLRGAGWVLGGVGVAGVVVGLVSGIVALSDKSSANCVNNVCDPGTLSGMKTASAVSTAGWVVGGVLVAGGAGLILFAPKGGNETPPPSAGVRLLPMFTASGGGMVAGGSF